MYVSFQSSGFGFLGIYMQKARTMASGPITSWQIDGETVQTVADFIFLGSKIIADDWCNQVRSLQSDGDCSHEIKRHLLFGRRVMTNLAAAAAKSLQSCPTLCDP